MSPKTNDLVFLLCVEEMKINHKRFDSVSNENLFFVLLWNSFLHISIIIEDMQNVSKINGSIEKKRYWRDAEEMKWYIQQCEY